MKNYLKAIVLIFLGLQSLGGIAQTVDSTNRMKYSEGDIVFGRTLLTLKEAKQHSVNVSAEAYENFRKAKVMSSWNAVWTVLGIWRVLAGANRLSQDDSSGGLLSVGMGSVFIAIPHFKGRKSRKNVYIKSGIEAYNEAISK